MFVYRHCLVWVTHLYPDFSLIQSTCLFVCLGQQHGPRVSLTEMTDMATCLFVEHSGVLGTFALVSMVCTVQEFAVFDSSTSCKLKHIDHRLEALGTLHAIRCGSLACELAQRARSPLLHMRRGVSWSFPKFVRVLELQRALCTRIIPVPWSVVGKK